MVGVRDYGDEQATRLKSLPNAANDACAVHRMLVEHYGFESKLLCHEDDIVRAESSSHGNTTLQSDGLGTAAELVDEIHAVRSRAGPHDLFVLFYAGHGSDDGYLVPYGGVRDRKDTYMSYNELFGELRSLPCLHKLLLFDCCFAGVVHRGESAQTTREGSLVWGKREEVIAATSSVDVALDTYTRATGVGQNSPFTASLLEALRGLSSGGSIRSTGLYEQIRRGMETKMVGSRRLEPTISQRGEGVLVLTRPGMRIEQARVLRVSESERDRCERLVASGGRPPLTWSAEPDIKGVSVEGNELRIDGAVLGPGRVELTLHVEDADGRVSRTAQTLLVTAATQSPPRIMTGSLPPCFVGRLYTAQIEVEGGSPPFRWAQTHLPTGLSLDEHGQVRGLVRSADRVTELVRLRVIDALDHEANAELRLLTIDPDKFCDIPAGPAKVGHHPDQETAEALFREGLGAAVVRNLAESSPSGEVYVPRYFVKKFPVTRGEWRQFLRASRHVSTPEWLHASHDDDLPATGLSRDDVEAYLSWRGSRLPSRFEWEKAARGSDGRPFPWGIAFDQHAANHKGLGWGDLTPVDQFPRGASPFGVQDLVGNCWERVRQFTPDRGGWLQHVRGGSMECGVAQLLAFASTELSESLRIDPETGELVADRTAVYPKVGFREVVEVDDSPPYPQGLVPVGRSEFELPSGETVRTRAFFMARYAVSNAEYLEFVRATRHDPPPHWSAEGRPFRFDARHLPVVNVTHADAKRFCEWKSEQLREKVQLPSRAEWRSAAYGPGLMANGFVVRSFPWGLAFDASSCNSAESGIGQALRVYDLPEGRAPCGAFHLVGNVFEWVAPDMFMGGSWATACADPSGLQAQGTRARFDIGFRYCSPRTPSRGSQP